MNEISQKAGMVLGAPRKTAFVFAGMPMGGAEDFALCAGTHLTPGFEAHFACLREFGRLGEEARDMGRPVHLVRVFPSRWITPWQIQHFADWLMLEKISLVHSQTHHAHIFATRAARLAGIPSVLHQQKTLEKLPARREKLFRACLERSSHVVALSARTAGELTSMYGVPKSKVSVVPNGIEQSIFQPASDRMMLRRELGLPSGLLIGTVARLHPHKNHALTIEAVARLRSEGTTVTAVLVGEGAQRAELENLARARGVSDAVIFAGGKRPVAPWIQALDLFVLPSVWEGQPLALLQAVACGIPVLASRIEGNVAVLGADHPGLFYAGDAGELAKLMKESLRNREFSPRLIMRQNKVIIPWSHEVAEQLATIYQSLLS